MCRLFGMRGALSALGRRPMLRTMITETPFEQTWVLQGKLTGQWAVDLKQHWNETKNTRQGRRCVVDLEDVTCVDAEGEELLKQVLSEGARIIVTRAYMKHVVESLDTRQL